MTDPMWSGRAHTVGRSLGVSGETPRTQPFANTYLSSQLNTGREEAAKVEGFPDDQA